MKCQSRQGGDTGLIDTAWDWQQGDYLAQVKEKSDEMSYITLQKVSLSFAEHIPVWLKLSSLEEVNIISKYEYGNCNDKAEISHTFFIVWKLRELQQPYRHQRLLHVFIFNVTFCK